ncbi:MAG: ribosome-associated translation inhibitor RaiA [Planctomycetes bacterium]|nr:ribosome-associated translation inhibitor RaiA [Planctomycetota bacterium]
MDLQHELILRDVTRTPGLERYVREKVDKLTQLTDRLLTSRVTIEAPSPHHKKGGHYHVSVELGLPGAELVANRAAPDDQGHESMHLALRDAFTAMRRQLHEHLAKQRRHDGVGTGELADTGTEG